MSKIIKSAQSCSNGHLPYHLFILLLSARVYCLARADSMDDVVCEFACALTVRSSNGRERPLRTFAPKMVSRADFFKTCHAEK